MKQINDVLEMWKEDSKIDRSEPGTELLKIPQLHSKYLNILSHNRMLCREVEIKYAKMKKIKWEYYSGRMDSVKLKEFGWQQFPYVLKSDISTYLESDDDLIKLSAQKSMYLEVIEICTTIMKELNSRTYQLRSYIDYEKFIQGVS